MAPLLALTRYTEPAQHVWPWPSSKQPKLQPCHQLGTLCHPGWTRHLLPSGDRKPLVMCGHGLDGEAPLRRS